MSKTLTDPFCILFNTNLAAFEGDLSRAMPYVLRAERETLVKLVAGLTVVLQFAAGKAPATGELNAVLATRLGNGYSWLNCVQFLAGARAREALGKHDALLRQLVDPALIDFGQAALPTMPETVRAIMADARSNSSRA
uniref:hypothetical protein n=1 Tax=Cupriavidus taiwanensis TaxID=164546 RepID=UPI003F498B28